MVGTCFPIEGVNTGTQPTTMIADVKPEDTALQVEVTADQIMRRSVANAVRLAGLTDEAQAIEQPTAKGQELLAPDRFRLVSVEQNPEMHALVVGGTGMLREVSLHLARRADTLSVVARRPKVLAGVPHIRPLPLDYRDDAALAGALRQANIESGPITLAVCWIHNTAPRALAAIAAELARPGVPVRIYHVVGSAAAAPSRMARRALDVIPPNCLYCRLVLGFVIEGKGSRWLTHAEISGGVIRALESDAAEAVVGVVRPWELRP